MRVSRRTLARYAAERLLDGDAKVMDELAALLVSEGRQRELDLLVRDIESAMAERGTVVATVESARALDAATRRAIEELLAASVSASSQRASHRVSDAETRAAELPDADTSAAASSHAPRIHLREVVRPELIGGVKVITPTQAMDATIAKKLHTLRAKKI